MTSRSAVSSIVTVDREIRATRHTAPRDFHTFGRVYLAVISKRLRSNRYDVLADLTEDVKVDLAKARIPYDSAHVSAAIRDLWAKRRGLLTSAPAAPAPPPVEPRRISREEAADILQRLRAQVASW